MMRQDRWVASAGTERSTGKWTIMARPTAAMPDGEMVTAERTRGEAKQYSRSKLAVGLLKLLASLVFLLVFLLSGASSRLDALVSPLTDNYYLQLSGYLLAFMAIYWVVLLGLDFYSGVVLEHRYGLSNQTTVRWFLRDALQWLLSTLLAIGAFGLV